MSSKYDDDYLTGLEELQQRNEDATQEELNRQKHEEEQEREDELDSAKSPDDY